MLTTEQLAKERAIFESFYRLVCHQPEDMWGWDETRGSFGLNHARMHWQGWLARAEWEDQG